MADRLILQIERGMVAQAQLRALLTQSAACVAGHRADLRNLKARIARKPPALERRK